jgi:methionyl aminopeptidase
MNVKLIQHIHASRIHQRVMDDLLPTLAPGLSLQEIVQRVETKISEERISRPAFPVGLGINHVVAHFTPDPLGSPILLKEGDLLKIDFGTHVEGFICDAALSVGIGERGREMHREILNISRKATLLGVRHTGIDVFLKEIGAEIEEYVMSKTVTYEGVEYPLFTMRDLCGHSIGPYQVHGGKAVPNTRIDFLYDAKMKEDEVYAIEPFVTTGRGTSIEDPDPNNLSHYAISRPGSPTSRAGIFYADYQTLPFSKYWPFVQENKTFLAKLERQRQRKRERSEPSLLTYPPLYDVSGSYVAQHEENVYITAQRAIQLTKMCETSENMFPESRDRDRDPSDK